MAVAVVMVVVDAGWRSVATALVNVVLVDGFSVSIDFELNVERGRRRGSSGGVGWKCRWVIRGERSCVVMGAI